MQNNLNFVTPNRTRLGTRLFSGYLITFILPLFTAGIFLSIIIPRYLETQAKNQLRTISLAREAQLLDWRNSLLDELNTILISNESRNWTEAVLLDQGRLELTDIYTSLEEHFDKTISQNQNFDILFVVNQDGQIKLSTNLAEQSGNVRDQLFFQQGQTAGTMQPPVFNPNRSEIITYAAIPFENAEGQTIGVIAGRANPEVIQAFFQTPLITNIQTESYLISTDYTQLTGTDNNNPGTPVLSEGALQAIGQRSSGVGRYPNTAGDMVASAYRWVPELQVGILSEQRISDLYAKTRQPIAIGLVLLGITMGLVFLFAILESQHIAQPVANVINAIHHLANGNLDVNIPQSRRKDEIGLLVNEFNLLADSIQIDRFNSQSVLAQNQQKLIKQNLTLLAFSDVSRALSTTLDPNKLIQQIVDLIRKNFDLYYVGLFLLDEDHKWAVLRAGTGEAGEIMRGRGHRLKIDERSMIGWSIFNEKERVAHEASNDPVRLATPELPLTRSEAALPMRARGKIIGALTVQSTQPDSFDKETVSMLQAMADQAAVALENARLFEDNRIALENASLAISQISKASWLKLLNSSAGIAYQGTALEVDTTQPHWDELAETARMENKTIAANEPDSDGMYALVVPIQAGGIVVGTLNPYKPQSDGPWSGTEIRMIEMIAYQLGLALESSRLYEESQRRADFEKLTGQVTTNIRERLDIDTVLRTTALEVSRALGLPEVTVRLVGNVQQAKSANIGNVVK
jgi:GAF domain-containing protein/HAMP domain-containing protein